MTTTTVTTDKGFRLALIIGGLVAVGFGVAVLVWPTKAAVALTGVLAVYAILTGIVYVASGFVAKKHGTGSRIGHALLGLLYIVAGSYAFASLQQSAAFLALFLTIMVGVMWVIEGFTALFTLGQSGAKGVTIVFAILSVLAGFSLLSMPVWGAGFLWWFLGVSLLVLGALNVVRGISGPRG